ncbi:ferredoxin [Rhodoglobus vestalii]|uniref:Ferredoxin n=1 Tax=Rhodoglobus vestalii TaxID=193384 RepID=A0A8H2K7C9_9MICO|nr:ferredoxin [Rhodoglobus vestalii]TQO20044.1 ferredoxin [Rhodoglobus vestalii]
MAFKVTVDLDLCQGYANCLIEGPALFDIDDDTNKAIVLGGDEHDEALRAQADAATRGCPARAIVVEDV